MNMQLSGNIWDYFIVFASGVVVSFSPCLYPVMPITASFIAGFNTKGSKARGFLISVIYVSGLAVTYCLLAAFAALSGQVFGKFQNDPRTYFVIANILLFFALVMLDVIPWPTWGSRLRIKSSSKNLWVVFLFGLSSGLVVGPCTAPILGTILLYVASRQNVLHGISLLFVFSYGVGASLILIGTFSGLLSSLPKSGVWLKRVKYFCAVVLFIMAEIYLIKAGKAM